MAFNSFNFWLVFPFIFGLYWLIPAKWNRWRKVFLVVASCLIWKPPFALESQEFTKKYLEDKKTTIW